MSDTMNVMKLEKRKVFERTRKIRYYLIIKDGLHMNDTYINIYNPIFDTLHQTAAHTPQSPT
jgi:hypothetical protein